MKPPFWVLMLKLEISIAMALLYVIRHWVPGVICEHDGMLKVS